MYSPPRTEVCFPPDAVADAMWPWGHLAVGYLAFVAGRRAPPGGPAALLLALGTQFPDIVDKPLAWHLGVIPNGRSLTHSAIVATAIVALVWWYAARRDRTDLALAFGVGYASHLAADALYPLLDGRLADLAFLAWPVLPAVEYTGSTSITARFAELVAAIAAGQAPGTLAFELALAAVAAALWTRHGYPGLGTLRRWITNTDR